MTKQVHRFQPSLSLADKIAVGVTILLSASLCWMYYQLIQLTP